MILPETERIERKKIERIERKKIGLKKKINKTYFDLIENKTKDKYFAEKYEQCKDGFYFSEGLKRLENLEGKYTVESLRKALATLKQKNDKENDKKNDAYDNFKKEHADLSESINGFVAYCDVNAKSTNDDGESYYPEEGKRCIAKAGIRQNAWIKNILQYLVNQGDDKYQGVAYGVKRAIMYFKDPQNIFPILSKNHQELIAKYFGLNLEENDFDEKLKDKLNGIIKIDVKDLSNLTSIYTSLIYDIKSEWIEKKFKKFNEIYKVLENNKNLILTGAPGTGKTYQAKELAREIIGLDLGEEEEFEKLESCEQFGFVQFHPSYDYTDFVEGLRPQGSADGNKNDVVFKRVDGVFKSFCEKALKDPEKKFVFVIDEINRGEISKIFGELFFSIDPGYRGKKGSVRTQYANMVTEPNDFDDKLDETTYGKFFVPENVYIIGTMNDIDRSVESMDFAFRRRFAFFEIEAEDTADAILAELDKNDRDIAKDAMTELNKKLVNESIGLTNAYHIGASYFAKVKQYSRQTTNKWNSLWNYHLKGTLYEYFRGEPDAGEKMKELKEVYDSKIPKPKDVSKSQQNS